MFHDVRYSHLQFPRAKTATYLLLAGVLMGAALLLNPHMYQNGAEEAGTSSAHVEMATAVNHSSQVHDEQFGQHDRTVAFSSPKSRR